MTEGPREILPPELELTLAHTGARFRDALRIFFDLDMRLGRIVAGTSEPMLGQMRLAWWRETLSKPQADRPSGDAVLDAIGKDWIGREAALIALVDGWEELLCEPPLGSESAHKFAAGRSIAMRAVFQEIGQDWDKANADHAAWHWSLADLATNVTLEEERLTLIELALERSPANRMPHNLRGIAVLAALALRSLRNDARPLMEGRGAALTALRAAIIGH